MMIQRTRRFGLPGLGLTLLAGPALAVPVVPVDDAEALASLLIGDGVTLVPGSATLVGVSGQAGTFTGGDLAGLGIDAGVLLTSGLANNATGPNNNSGTGTGFGTAGDPTLSAQAGNETFDANILSFLFETETGDLFFQYVFASEEYNEFVDSSFNDAFALLIDGVNVAIAPDGQVVTINNVNCGSSGNDATAPNCDSFVDNTANDVFVEYDGLTTVLTASVLGLGPGEHSAVFAIADAGDTGLDSGVFIAGGSLVADPDPDPEPVDEPALAALLLAGLVGMGGQRLRRRRMALRRDA